VISHDTTVTSPDTTAASLDTNAACPDMTGRCRCQEEGYVQSVVVAAPAIALSLATLALLG
jgi:hypothetical protein